MRSVQRHWQSSDIVSGVDLPLSEASAWTLGSFDGYSFSREQNGVMSLRVYSNGGFREINQPHEALAAAIDIILRNAATLTYGHYVVGNDVGLWAQGALSGATAADGTPIHSFQFRRLSGGEREIWLAYGNGTIHGGRNLPWELSLQVLNAACAPRSSTIKVIGTALGDRIVTCTTTYDLRQ